MQLFGLATCPTDAAQRLCNAHVTKQTLETTQILYSLLLLSGVSFTDDVDCGTHGRRPPYKLAYKNHPIVLWAKASRAHARWVLAHAKALAAEFRARNDDVRHLCEHHIDFLATFLDGGGWPASMPDSVTPDEWLASLDAKQRAGVAWRVATTSRPMGCTFGIVAMDMIGPRRFPYSDWVGSYVELYTWKQHHAFARPMKFGMFGAVAKRRRAA